MLPGPGGPEPTALAPARYAAPGGGVPDLCPTGSEALLPRAGAGFALAFLLAAMRPDAARWLGRDGLARLAAPLGLRPAVLGALLDTAPPPPLGESGPWIGSRIPIYAKSGEVAWIELCWRPDRQATGRRRDQGGFALRLILPEHGRIEIRGRLEGARLDAVMEIEQGVPRPVEATLPEAFGRMLKLLGLQGEVTVRNGKNARRA